MEQGRQKMRRDVWGRLSHGVCMWVIHADDIGIALMFRGADKQ